MRSTRPAAVAPLLDERRELGAVVTLVAVLERQRVLRSERLALLRQDPEVGRSRGLGQASEELLVHVLVADVDLLHDEHFVQVRVERRLPIQERREIMAPFAPVSAGDQQQQLILGRGLRDGEVELLERVRVRVVADVLLGLRWRESRAQRQRRGGQNDRLPHGTLCSAALPLRGTRPRHSRRRQLACIRSIAQDSSLPVGENVTRTSEPRGRTAPENRMRISTERTLTTHVGSLPRSSGIVELLYKKDSGETYDHDAFDAAV